MPQHFFYGRVKQPFDPRDTYYNPPSGLRSVDYCDISADMGSYLDQKDLGSCGPNTADEMCMYDQKVQGLSVTSISRLHLYWWTRYLMGTTNQDSGVDNRSLMKAWNQYGVCPEPLCPYITANFKNKPSDAANQAGLQNKITDYAAVIQSPPQMQNAILTLRRPILFGFTVYKQIESDEAATTGIIRSPGPGETPVGGHDMSLCGFTNVDRPGNKPGLKWPAGTYKLRQHWTNYDGSPWGDCLFGETKISLLDGSQKSIGEIFETGEEVWVYSVDERTHRIVPAKAKPVFSGTRNDLVRVTLDNGEAVVCTRDHKWMLREGGFKDAAALKSGDSLMPLYRKDDHEYERFYSPDSHRWITTHWSVAHDQDLRDCMEGHTEECQDEKCKLVVHHYNFNERDNTPDNLRVMYRCVHQAFHSKIGSEGKSEQMRERWRKDYEKMAAAARKNFSQYNADVREGRRQLSEAHIEALRRNVKVAAAAAAKKLATSGITEKQRAARKKNIEVALVARGLTRLPVTNNHKVVSVEPIDLFLPTYDLKVQREHCHNFALGAGVFVHNSGYGYIPYTYAHDPNQAGDFWVANSIPGGTAPIPVPPGPTPTPPGPTVAPNRIHFSHNVPLAPGGGPASWPISVRGLQIGTLNVTAAIAAGKTFGLTDLAGAADPFGFGEVAAADYHLDDPHLLAASAPLVGAPYSQWVVWIEGLVSQNVPKSLVILAINTLQISPLLKNFLLLLVEQLYASKAVT